LTEEYLEDSSRMITRTKQLILAYDYVGAIEAAQHSIEVSIKALYLLVGEEPPKEHHAGEEFLKRVVGRLDFSDSAPFGADYCKAKLGRAMFIGKMYEWAHTVSVYGYKGLSASRLIEKRDAEIASEYAEEVYSTCRVIVDAVKYKQITISQKERD